MTDKIEIQNALECINRIEELKKASGFSCDELVATVTNVIDRIQENSKVIGLLIQEIKTNEITIESHLKAKEIKYEIDDDGFTNLDNKKSNQE